MLYVGIDTHLEMHELAIVNENAEIVWSGRVGNNRIGFQYLLAKLKTIEKSRNDKIIGMDLTRDTSHTGSRMAGS